MEYQYIFQALETILKNDDVTIRYLREELEKERKRANELEEITEEQAALIKTLEEELDFYKPNTKGEETE